MGVNCTAAYRAAVHQSACRNAASILATRLSKSFKTFPRDCGTNLFHGLYSYMAWLQQVALHISDQYAIPHLCMAWQLM